MHPRIFLGPTATVSVSIPSVCKVLATSCRALAVQPLTCGLPFKIKTFIRSSPCSFFAYYTTKAENSPILKINGDEKFVHSASFFACACGKREAGVCAMGARLCEPEPTGAARYIASLCPRLRLWQKRGGSLRHGRKALRARTDRRGKNMSCFISPFAPVVRFFFIPKKVSLVIFQGHLFWSERRESNPRESAWEADAIPLGDSRKFSFVQYLLYYIRADFAIDFGQETKDFHSFISNLRLRRDGGKRRCFRSRISAAQ